MLHLNLNTACTLLHSIQVLQFICKKLTKQQENRNQHMSYWAVTSNLKVGIVKMFSKDFLVLYILSISTSNKFSLSLLVGNLKRVFLLFVTFAEECPFWSQMLFISYSIMAHYFLKCPYISLCWVRHFHDAINRLTRWEQVPNKPSETALGCATFCHSGHSRTCRPHEAHCFLPVHNYYKRYRCKTIFHIFEPRKLSLEWTGPKAGNNNVSSFKSLFCSCVKIIWMSIWRG